jgi:hypothetical protein
MPALCEGTADRYVDYLIEQREDFSVDYLPVSLGELHDKRRADEQKDKYKHFCDILKKNSYDPVEFQIRVAQNECIEWSVRERANKSLLERYIPALKSIDHTISRDTLDNILDLKKQMQSLEIEQKKDY